jgi:hypothetical protein
MLRTARLFAPRARDLNPEAEYFDDLTNTNMQNSFYVWWGFWFLKADTLLLGKREPPVNFDPLWFYTVFIHWFSLIIFKLFQLSNFTTSFDCLRRSDGVDGDVDKIVRLGNGDT